MLSTSRAMFVGRRTLSGTGNGPPVARENTPERVGCGVDGSSVGVVGTEAGVPLASATVPVDVVPGNIPVCILFEDGAAT